MHYQKQSLRFQGCCSGVTCVGKHSGVEIFRACVSVDSRNVLNILLKIVLSKTDSLVRLEQMEKCNVKLLLTGTHLGRYAQIIMIYV